VTAAGCAILDGQNRTSGIFSRTRRRVFVFPLATTDPTRDFWPAGYDGASASPDFANGAVTAAFSYAFGEMAHRSRDAVTVTGAGSDVEGGAATGGPDVLGSPEMDAAMIGHFDDMPRSAYREQGFGYLPGGSFTRNYWISESGGSFNVPSSAIGIGHTHVRGAWEETIQREWPGPGDHRVVMGGRPNYFRSPAGAVRVVERTDGQFRLRTVLGQPYNDAQWSPGRAIDITNRMRACQCIR